VLNGLPEKESRGQHRWPKNFIANLLDMGAFFGSLLAFIVARSLLQSNVS